jgi:hypothetical protein
MTTPTTSQIRNWMRTHYNDKHNECFVYRNATLEIDMTLLSESCAEHFGVLSEDGNTEIEETIFEIASEFFSL